MSNTVHLASLTNINPTLLIKGISPVLVDICCYELFKKSLSPKKTCIVAGLAGIATTIVFCPRDRTGMIGTALAYLVYKISHYFLIRQATITKPPESTTPAAATSKGAPASSTVAKPSASQREQPKPTPAKPPAAATSKGTLAPSSTVAKPSASQREHLKPTQAKPPATAISKGAPASSSTVDQSSTLQREQSRSDLTKPSAAAMSKSTPTAAKPSAPLREIPSPSEITTKYDTLRDKVTLRFEDPFNVAPDCSVDKIHQVIEAKEGFQKEKRELIIRQIWNSITEESAQLVKEAGAEMLKLYLDLLTATKLITNKDDRNKAMAQLLINDERFSERFYPSNTKTILHIYRFIRGLRYIIQCPSLEHHQVKESKKLIFHTQLTDADILPFSQPNTPQLACREAYNKVVEVYTPLIPHLPPEYSKWLVKDEAGKSFAIIPPKK